jgi:hypothetical protein
MNAIEGLLKSRNFKIRSTKKKKSEFICNIGQ